jgi:hypothetical protein
MSDQLMGFCIFDVLLCVRGSAHSCIPLTIVPISSSFSQTIKELVGLSWYHLFSLLRTAVPWLVSICTIYVFRLAASVFGLGTIVGRRLSS